MTDTREMTPGDRRELRSLVKKQFAILRNDVKRREAELRSEIESELLRRYQQQDQDIRDAGDEARRAMADFLLAMDKICDDLRERQPGLSVEHGKRHGQLGSIMTHDETRNQQHRALLAAIPQQVASANTQLDQDELELLRDLTIGALDTDQAHAFLARIPTVGQLVPKARLAELEVGSS